MGRRPLLAAAAPILVILLAAFAIRASDSPPASKVDRVTGAVTDLSVRVDGNRLVDRLGRTVTLHGVNISGTEWRCLHGPAFPGPSDNASIAAIAAWHANAVRVPLNENCWLGVNG